eukprot:TRINITY_DN7109_c0_g1_i2.p1 TRINITY_DN7109_c0_g1~~TRINITY_DN7109_c0_g1_i2.p1  ORF type:complete len:205 (-),score=40.29 TRINITY_DN7109_c0_g1_i2:344-880(-)
MLRSLVGSEMCIRDRTSELSMEPELSMELDLERVTVEMAADAPEVAEMAADAPEVVEAESELSVTRRPGRETLTWARCNGSEFGVWTVRAPMMHRLPARVRVINKRQALRKSADYPGRKLGLYCEVGLEAVPVEYARFQFHEMQLNCYKVELEDGWTGWLLDYSPGERLDMLQIQYHE